MKTANPTHLKYRGPFPCKGSCQNINPPHDKYLSLQQAAWMIENKPLYYTRMALTDIHHLPQHLRHV